MAKNNFKSESNSKIDEKKPGIFKIETITRSETREVETSCCTESLQIFEFELSQVFGNDHNILLNN